MNKDENNIFSLFDNTQKLIDNNKQKLFEEVINNARDIIFILNEDGEILCANKEAIKEYGYTDDEFKSMIIFDLRNPKGKGFANNQFSKAKSVGIEFETYHYRKDGTRFTVEVKSVGINVENDKYVVSIIRNIEKRRKVEEEVRALASIVESSEDAIIGENIYGIIRSWNKGAEKLFGYTKDEVMGKHISIVASDNSIDNIEDNLHKVRNGIKIENYETCRKRKNGEIVTVSITVSPIYDTDNNIIGISAIVRDITEKQNLINMVNASEKKYRNLFSAMNQGVALHEIIVDENNKPIDFRFLDMNESFLRILNANAEDYIGRTVHEITSEIEEYWIEKLGEVALSGIPIHYENYSKKFDKYFDVYAFSPAQGQFAVVMADVTERKLKEIQKAMTDEPTGIYNRRYIDERLPVELNKSVLQDYPISMIMTDIDNLKDINDKYGHITGDKIIKDFAKLIKNQIIRDSDWVGRYGGDKFLIVLNNTELENAYIFAERVRKMLKESIFEYGDAKIKATSSFGVYCTRNEKWDIEDLLTKVDKNLYEAKRKGKNRTIINNYIRMNDMQLKILNNEIQELRDNLNEICMPENEIISETQKLKISDYLDKLTLEYLKNLDKE